MADMEDINWTKIFSSSLEHEVDIIKGVLAESEIDSVIINKKDSLYLIGEVELYVNSEQAFIAQQLINQIFK